MAEPEGPHKLVKQINFVVEPAMYEQLRLAAFNSRTSISSLVRSRLTLMTEEDFRIQAVDPAKGKITLEQIILLLRRIGVGA